MSYYYNPVANIIERQDPALVSVISDISNLKTIQFKVAYYEEITTTSGQISIPSETTILLNQWDNGVDAVISAIQNTKPDFEDTGLDVTSFDSNGNYTISGALPTTPSALIFYLIVSLESFNNLNKDYIVEFAELSTGLTNSIDYLEFNTNTTNVSTNTGAVQWNPDEQTLDVILPNGVVGQMFQEQFFDVINQTGSTLNNISPVMFGGTLGASGKITPQLAIANGVFPPNYTMGLVTQDIVNGGEGKVTWFGKVRNVNTTGTPYGEVWNDGDIIYVSPTLAGNLTNVKPEAPNYAIIVAAVIKAHTNGTLFVRPTWNGKLTDLADVNGTPLTSNGQFPVWDNTNKYFDFTENILNYAKLLTSPEFNSIVISKLLGNGIKIDTTTPSFPYVDLIGDIVPKTSAVGAPTLTNFIGNVRAFRYSAGDDGDLTFHIPHDWVVGSQAFIHVHWGHNGTTISGNFILDLYITYANRTLNTPAEVFSTQITPSVSINTLGIVNTPQYAHRVDEIPLTSVGGSATTLDSDSIEVDGLVMVHYDMNTIPNISGGGTTEPFIFTIDIHYQSTGIGTKSKDPDYRV